MLLSSISFTATILFLALGGAVVARVLGEAAQAVLNVWHDPWFSLLTRVCTTVAMLLVAGAFLFLYLWVGLLLIP